MDNNKALGSVRLRRSQKSGIVSNLARGTDTSGPALEQLPQAEESVWSGQKKEVT
jgi:hypothetical protein